jgi:hypothetical protein
VLDEQARKHLVQFVTASAENRCLSFEAISAALQWGVSASTIRRALALEEFSHLVASVKRFFNIKAMVNRLRWARQHAHWTVEQWRAVLWTDESSMQVLGPQRVWVTRMPGEEYTIDCFVLKFRKLNSCMIWGSISGLYGLSECTLFIVKKFLLIDIGPMLVWDSEWGRVTGAAYSNRIVPLVVNHLYYRPAPMFQQDNASTHTAKVTKGTLAYYRIVPLEWPASSPDLNPIETIWQWIKQRIRAHLDQPRRLEDLCCAVIEEWHSITHAENLEIVDTMVERIRAVIAANGGHTQF